MARARLVLLHRSIPDRSRRGSGLSQCESHCGELDGPARRGVCSSLFIAGVGVAGGVTSVPVGGGPFPTKPPPEAPRPEIPEAETNPSAPRGGGVPDGKVESW